jgi:hypothetical protein
MIVQMVAYDFVLLHTPSIVTLATLQCAIKSRQPGKADKPEIPTAVLGVESSLCNCFVRCSDEKSSRLEFMLMTRSEIGLVLNQ